MFAAVILKLSKRLVVVPIRWIKNFVNNSEQNYNFGGQKTQNRIIFYSKVHSHVPNFDFNPIIKKEFDNTNDGYYFANILRIFGKYILTICNILIFNSNIILNYN